MKRIILILTALSIFIGLFASCKKKNEETSVDLVRDDLSEYVEIDSKHYKGYTVKSNINVLVAHEIIKEQFKHRSAEPVQGDGIVSVGDAVNIFYKGYYIQGEEKVYFDGGSNMGKTAYKLEIGSGGFIPGFEYNMIGKNPSEYSETNPMLVETYFPTQYQQSPDLAGRTAYFEVFVEIKDGKLNMTEYSVPEINDAFITETLKISADTLASYEGETLADKYFGYMKKNYITKNNFNVNYFAENAFWESATAGAVIKKYPEKQLREAKEDIRADLVGIYENNPYYSYYSLEDFICLYLGYDTKLGADTVIDIIAKERLNRQMIFYQIMNQEGLKPSEEKYNEIFDEYLENALKGNGVTPESFDTEGEYAAEKEKFKKELLEKNGDEYFRSMIYYEIGIAVVLAYANIVEIPVQM